MSQSIGDDFSRFVRPFLESLAGDAQLNVGPTGTPVSLILFSNKEYTKVAFDFGDY